MFMCDSYSLELNFKFGIVKELHKRELISDAQMKRILKILIEQDNVKMGKRASEEMSQNSEKVSKGAYEK